MESRKLVKSGNTSFTVAIPINWIRKNRLEAGNEIQIEENNQGDLVIQSTKPIEGREEELVTKTIYIDGKEDKRVKIEMLIAYIRDYPSISIEGTELKKRFQAIMEQMESFIGYEVMEQGDKYVSIKNFFRLDKDMAPKAILNKMNVVNRASFEVLSQFFDRSLTQEDVFEIQKFHKQNKKLANLCEKSIFKLFNDSNLLRGIQTNRLQLMKDKKTVTAYKKISTRLFNISKLFILIDHESDEARALKEVFYDVRRLYEDFTTSVAMKDTERVLSILSNDKLNKIIKALDDVVNSMDDHLIGQSAISLSIILSFLKEIAYESLI